MKAKLIVAVLVAMACAVLAGSQTNSPKTIGHIQVIIGVQTNLLRWHPACDTCTWGVAEEMIVNITTNIPVSVTSNGMLFIENFQITKDATQP